MLVRVVVESVAGAGFSVITGALLIGIWYFSSGVLLLRRRCARLLRASWFAFDGVSLGPSAVSRRVRRRGVAMVSPVNCVLRSLVLNCKSSYSGEEW
jgi:hypothetical protein